MKRPSRVVYTTDCLSGPSMVLEIWRMSRKMLVFGLCWNFKVGSKTSEGIPQHQYRRTCHRGESKLAKTKASFFHILLCGLPPKGMAQT